MVEGNTQCRANLSGLPSGSAECAQPAQRAEQVGAAHPAAIDVCPAIEVLRAAGVEVLHGSACARSRPSSVALPAEQIGRIVATVGADKATRLTILPQEPLARIDLSDVGRSRHAHRAAASGAPPHRSLARGHPLPKGPRTERTSRTNRPSGAN